MVHLIIILPISALLACTYIRYRSYKKLLQHGLDDISSGTDTSTQFFYFIKTLTQQSLCPAEYNNQHKGACLYYPLGIYWLSINLALRLKKATRKLITLDDLKDESSYPSLALKICLAINILIIPLLISISIVSLPYLLINNYVYSTLLSVFLVIYMNLYLSSINYPVQTRTIGFFCATVFALYLIVSFVADYNPLDIGFLFDANNYPISNSLDATAYAISSLFGICTLSSLIFVCTRSSQQGSQFLISLLISASIISTTEYFAAILIGIFLAINIPMYQPSLDTINFYKTHILNRFNDNSWYLRTYGVQKYKLLSFSSFHLLNSIKSILSFDIDPQSGQHHVRYKSSWISQLLENRVLLYCLLILMNGFINARGIKISDDFSFNLILLFSSATIIPCILCCLRVFQGYGPPLHYIEFFTPFNWFALLIYINNNEINHLGVSAILLDLLITTLVLIRKSIQFSIPIISYEDKLDDVSTVDKFILKKERVILEYVNLSVGKHTTNEHKFSTIKGHYQMVLECSIILFSNKFKNPILGEAREMNPFPIIDSLDYSFYHHWDWIYTKFKSIIQKNVTEIFFDTSNPQESEYILSLKKYQRFANWKIIKTNISSMAIFKEFRGSN